MAHIKPTGKGQYIMKPFHATAVIACAGLLAFGCATKKYARNTAAPIQAKVDQVGEQTSKNSQSIEETRQQVKAVDERAQNGISSAQERAATADQHALTADQHAGNAANRADQASQAADMNRNEIGKLRGVIENIDDYKLQLSVSVPFGFNVYSLSKDAKQDLDKLAGDVKADKRFFIAVEGYTDQTGSHEYNETLSRRRADSVVEYLVGQCDVPVYRIHMTGLGDQKPIAQGRNRAANARNRRVEVKVFSADEVTASLAATPESSTADRTSTGNPNQ
jgi:outer membrane protein OmpA-like peptidoglycan-associated protein